MIREFSAKSCPWRSVLLKPSEITGAITFGHRLAPDAPITEFYGLRDGRLFKVGTREDFSADACFPAVKDKFPDGIPLLAVRIVDTS